VNGDLPGRAQALGARPLLAVDPIGGGREPLLPETPTAAELLAGQPRATAAGCLAGLAAARLTGALVLPALTPADIVAAWRHAAQRWAEEAGGPGTQVVGAGAAVAVAALCPSAEASLAYREWLALRLNRRAA
jgi:hypothetical protein